MTIIRVISYKLDERGSIPDRVLYFRHRVSTGFGFHRPFYAIGIDGCFPWAKRSEREAYSPRLFALTSKFFDFLYERTSSPSKQH
jgi:hypothetical protein